MKQVDTAAGSHQASQPKSVAEEYKKACLNFKDPEVFISFFQTHYDNNAHFKDPVFEGYGYGGVVKYCEKICNIVKDLSVDHWETVHEDNKVVMHWDITIYVKYWPFKVRIPGTTLLVFNDNDKCVEHIEYWDLFNTLINVVPIIPTIFKLFPKKWRENLVFLR